MTEEETKAAVALQVKAARALVAAAEEDGSDLTIMENLLDYMAILGLAFVEAPGVASEAYMMVLGGAAE